MSMHNKLSHTHSLASPPPPHPPPASLTRLLAFSAGENTNTAH